MIEPCQLCGAVPVPSPCPVCSQKPAVVKEWGSWSVTCDDCYEPGFPFGFGSVTVLAIADWNEQVEEYDR